MRMVQVRLLKPLGGIPMGRVAVMDATRGLFLVKQGVARFISPVDKALARRGAKALHGPPEDKALSPEEEKTAVPKRFRRRTRSS